MESLESAYISKSNEDRERLFYDVRDSFNKKKPEINFHTYDAEWVPRAAQSIFLNRTCFNGLFRMNRKGEFNVPFGRYKNPQILNKDNLKDVAALLKTTTILLGDFTRCKKFVDNTSLCIP